MKVGSWIVKMKCTVYKEVIVSDCTKEEAESNPWEFAEGEIETEQIDWEIISIKENE